MEILFTLMPKRNLKGEKYTIDIDYSGNPRIAKRAPWDGGWVFTTDKQGNPWVTVAQERRRN
jgi:phage pi2 protein 07